MFSMQKKSVLTVNVVVKLYIKPLLS